MTNPTGGATFSVDTAVTYGASALHRTGGTIASVTFRATNTTSTVLGTDTTAPYSVTSSSLPAGVYSVTAVARDTQNREVSSSAITVKISKALKAVRNTRKNASLTETASASFSANLTSNQVDSLVAELQSTYMDFNAERAMFASATKIDNYLFAAVFLARSSASLAKQSSLTTAVSDRISKLDAYLGFCEDLMVNDSISSASLNAASRVNAKTDLTISQPVMEPMMASRNSDVGMTAIPGYAFANDTFNVGFAGPTYELGNVSVTIQGKAAQMQYVSPTLVIATVPSDATPGLASVVVTSREGFISHAVVSISGLKPTLFLNEGNSTQGAIFNGLGVYGGSFSTVTPAQYLGMDARTRLSILATGISTGLNNTDSSNDVWLANGQMLANLAESVAVEARKGDGTTISLPVEYAGKQGDLSGLDQVNVVLPVTMAGAGTLQLTVVINGVRSNTITVFVQ